jgi:hypothetical protein
MVHVPECAAWTWDARPYPFFPALTDVWTDGTNWRLGHWLTGRLGAVSLAVLVRHLCLRTKVGELTMDTELLQTKIARLEAGAPFSARRTTKQRIAWPDATPPRRRVPQLRRSPPWRARPKS